MKATAEEIFHLFCISQSKFDFNGTCLLTSCLLYESFKDNGIKSTIIMGSWEYEKSCISSISKMFDTKESLLSGKGIHVWVKVGDKIYDPIKRMKSMICGIEFLTLYYPGDYSGVLQDGDNPDSKREFTKNDEKIFKDFIKDCYYGRGYFKGEPKRIYY